MNDNEIHFDEASHTYTNSAGEILISVSTIIHLYSPPFDPTGEIIKRCAEKKGVSIAELQAEWDKERDDANDRGTRFHSQAEHWVKTGEVQKGDYEDVVQQLKKFPFKGKLLSEQIVYSNKYKFAGTIDLIEDLGKKRRKLYDFKTNKQLKPRGYFNRSTGEYTKMLYPLGDLEDCNWVHYCLQLSGYQILQEEAGHTIIDRELIYVNPRTRELERYEVPDLREDFMRMVNHYRSFSL